VGQRVGKRTCGRLLFLGVGRAETSWPIKGTCASTEAVTSETVADAIIDSGVGRGEFGKGSKETLGGILAGLLRTKARGLQASGSEEV